MQVLFPTFIVQLTNLLQFLGNFQKFHRQHESTLQSGERRWRVAHLNSSGLSFMQATASIMQPNGSPGVSTFLLYTRHFVNLKIFRAKNISETIRNETHVPTGCTKTNGHCFRGRTYTSESLVICQKNFPQNFKISKFTLIFT